MKLPISPMSQRDQRWASQRLGTVNGITIGSHGCITTDMCMLATYYGHPILPNQIDDILTNQHLYFDGDLFVNNSITRIFPDIKFDKVVFCESTAAPIAEIKRYLDEGKPSVVALINQGIRHYVLVTGYEGDRIFCNDPWQGDHIAINDRWGNPATKILQINFFSGPVPAVSTIAPIPTPNHPLDGPHMDDTPPVNIPVDPIVVQPVIPTPPLPPPPIPLPPSPPINPPVMPQPQITIQPVDVEPIKETLNQGLSDIQETLAEVIIGLSSDPAVKKTTNQVFIDSLKSRKFILSVLASATAFVNSTFHLGLSQDQLMIFILPILAYVIVEGAADIVGRFKTLQPK